MTYIEAMEKLEALSKVLENKEYKINYDIADMPSKNELCTMLRDISHTIDRATIAMELHCMGLDQENNYLKESSSVLRAENEYLIK